MTFSKPLLESNTSFESAIPLNTAVLFLVFNRSKLTAQAFQAIHQAKPPRLYVAADGPRADRAGEAERCAEVRRIATEVDWDCEVKTLFRQENAGCCRAVSSALDWFFENEDEGIILEDDCVPDPSFFLYSQTLLARYRDDQRVMVIAGNHFHGPAHQPPYSYFFSRYNHCWGWASWRRAWQLYDRDMALWPELRQTNWLLGVGDGSRVFQRYWTEIFDMAYAGKVDSWAYRWTFSCWAQHGLSILPARHLVTNIGFGEGATHTKGENTLESKLKLESLAFPLVHPPTMVRDFAADKWSDCHVSGINKLVLLKNTLYRIPGVQTILTKLLKYRAVS